MSGKQTGGQESVSVRRHARHLLYDVICCMMSGICFIPSSALGRHDLTRGTTLQCIRCDAMRVRASARTRSLSGAPGPADVACLPDPSILCRCCTLLKAWRSVPYDGAAAIEAIFIRICHQLPPPCSLLPARLPYLQLPACLAACLPCACQRASTLPHSAIYGAPR